MLSTMRVSIALMSCRGPFADAVEAEVMATKSLKARRDFGVVIETVSMCAKVLTYMTLLLQ